MRRNRIRALRTAILVAFLLLAAGGAWGQLRTLFYHPRPYSDEVLRALPAGCVKISYRTSNGAQTSFYIAPAAKTDDERIRIWVCCHGNASLALEWIWLIQQVRERDPGAAFLLFDYPGFGLCEGRPTRQSVIEASEKAFRALAAHLRRPESGLEADLNVLGYSIGAAVGLEFASRHPVKRIVLAAPFTSIVDMARLRTGWPLCHIVPDRFDNRRQIGRLMQRSSPPAIDIFHGVDDAVIPFEMGKTLADLYPDRIVLHTVRGAGHADVLTRAEKEILDALAYRPSLSERSRATEEPRRE